MINPARVLSDTLATLPRAEYDPNTKTAFTVRGCEAARLHSALLKSRQGKYHTLVEWLEARNRVGRLLSTHQDTFRFRSGYSMHTYWKDADDQWYFLRNSNLDSDVRRAEQYGISPLHVNSVGLLFSFNESTEIAQLCSQLAPTSLLDRVRLSGVHFTELPNANPGALRYHSQFGLVGVSPSTNK